MSSIVDEGHWLYAAVLVAAFSLLFQSGITNPIYYNYEAVYRELPSPQAKPATESTPKPTNSYDEEEETEGPHYVIEHRPLPVVGNSVWKVLSFAPGSFISTLMGLAVLYTPCLILLVSLSGTSSSFGVLFRRDYGPLLTCALMAWTASHLPATLVALLHSPGIQTALGLWVFSAIYFGLLMALALRMLFGINYTRGLIIVLIAAAVFIVQPKIFSAVSPFLFHPSCFSTPT